MRLRPSLDWLLLLVPVTLVLQLTHSRHQSLLFVLACLSIVPLAGWMGKSTEQLAEKAGEGLGGLLNATFGNAAELIIALMALNNGLSDIVKASLTGSIIGNILLVTGASILAGGVRFKDQRFNASGARIQSTMLTLAAIALIAPAVFHHLVGPSARRTEADLSLDISIVLLITYVCSLFFSLRTHRHLFSGENEAVDGGERGAAAWSMSRSLLTLMAATGLVVFLSEVLVKTVEQAATEFGMSGVFVGVIVVAIIGNAAEHSTAVHAALKDRMDLSLGIAIGSSIQIALLVAPVLVVASRFMGPAPINLVFSPAEVVAIALSVVLVGQIAGDGESNWLEGVQLLAVYLILAMVFYFLPT